MAYLIDKDALVAEIEKRRRDWQYGNSIEAKYKREECDDILKCIDSLQEESVSERFAFKAIPRLLDMIEPTDRAKAYITKLADTLEVEGYSTDAKIVRESLKIMNDEKVPMATMDGDIVSEDLEKVANYKFDDIEEKWRDIIDTYPNADAFIEKTLEWLKEIVAYYTENDKAIIESFRKYMKGE